MDDFSKYEGLLAHGSSPQEIYLAARADGLDSITLVRLLRKVCGLSLVEAKEVIVTADQLATSLTEYQERFIPGLERALAPDRVERSSAELPQATRSILPKTDPGTVLPNEGAVKSS